MRSSKAIHVISCHAEGEAGDVIVGGVRPPPGKTLWEMARWIARDECLRNFMLNEPRGGVFRHVNLLVPPVHPDADAAWIIMEPEDTPPMSGSNSICVSTVLLESGIIPMIEPETEMHLEAPRGLIKVFATCEGGKVKKVCVTNVASFVDKQAVPLEIAGMGTLIVDTAYGGDSFVIVDATDLGFAISPDEAGDIIDAGRIVTAAANEQIGFRHPEIPDWNHISFCQFAAPVTKEDGVLCGRNAVVIQPGKIDRSPTGTGCSARMALLHAQGLLGLGERFLCRSIINSQFEGRLEGLAKVGERNAVIPSVTGRAWITGIHQHMLDPDDPWPEGYRIGDTWLNS